MNPVFNVKTLSGIVKNYLLYFPAIITS